MYKNTLVALLLLTSPLFLVALWLTNLFYTCLNIYVLLFCGAAAMLTAVRLSERLSREGLAVKILLLLLSILTSLGFLITLAAYGEARSIGSDYPLKNSFLNMRAEAELYREVNGSFSSFCTSETMISADKKISEQYIRIQTNCYGLVVQFFLDIKEPAYKPTCNANVDEYAVDAYLPREQKYYCVDYTGQAKSFATSIGNKTRCGE